MSTIEIGPGTKVTLHFSLKLDDGSVVDSNYAGEPAAFEIGDGNLLEGFEQALFGLKAGAEASFVIPPEKGFGQSNPNNVQTMPRDQFNGIDLEVGLVVSFADAQNTELPGVVKAFDSDSVTIDHNHPLAGRDIIFDVKIIDVEPAKVH